MWQRQEAALARVESQLEHRLQAKAVLLFISALPSESLTRTMYPGLEALKYYAEGLDRHGLLSPGLRKSLSIENGERRPTTRSRPRVDGLIFSGTREVRPISPRDGRFYLTGESRQMGLSWLMKNLMDRLQSLTWW